MTTSLRSALASMVADETLLPEGEHDQWAMAGDGGPLPAAVLAPGSEDELAGILGKSSEEGWRVLPAGLGRWLNGGGPSEADLVVSTRRMTQVREYEPADLTFTAGSGLSLKELHEQTDPHGQWLPLDPPGSHSGSLGAAVALGMAGPLRHLYGTPRDHVLGLTMVAGDGRVLRWGGRVVKNVAGFDLTRLTVGSWGSLGVVTSVSARLFPIPESDVTLAFPGSSVAELLPKARVAALSPLPLAAVELLDSLDPGDEAPGPALVVRLLGSAAQVDEMESRIVRDLGQSDGGTRRLQGDMSRALQRRLEDWEGGSHLSARLSLLPSKLGTLLEEVEGLRPLVVGWSEPGATMALSAHVGAGVVRLRVSKLPAREEALEPWITALRDLRGRMEDQGGSLVLSSGPPGLMREVGPWGTPGPERHLLEGLKAEFDPAGILASGRLNLP
ncbi:MAG: FAD-binding oxidoreductase [Gemmatimonadetes bacterium]|nr:FAD-binding oxidoreductase [Gemmatimonadota bacterium]